MNQIFSYFDARLEPRIDVDFVEPEDRDSTIRMIDALEATNRMWVAEQHLRLHNDDTQEVVHLARKYAGKLLALYGRPPGVFVHCLALLKYGVGGNMRMHSDRMNEECSDCVLSAVMYLNDAYEGGEIFFPRISKSYHPAPGTCVSYPSLWPAYDHGVHAVTAGTRYAMAWCFTANADRAFRPYLGESGHSHARGQEGGCTAAS
jgi:hypothetical protein